MFFAVVLDTHFAHNLLFRGPFGVQFVMLFRVPGTLGNRLRTLKGIRFAHFGDPFWRGEFKANSERYFFVDFNDFGHFLVPVRGLFWDENVKRWDTEKRPKKKPLKFIQEDPTNSDYRPCGPLKEIKEAANSPGLRPKRVT